jgi:hypothetical protein
MNAHSEAVAYYLAQAREAIRQASAEHHKHADPPPRPEPDVGTAGTTRVQPVRAAIAARKEDG